MNKDKIKNIAVFFNNTRGLYIYNHLAKKKFNILPILTRKFLNNKILKLIKNKKKIKLIKNLKDNSLKKYFKKEKYDLFIAAGFPHIFNKSYLAQPKFGIINLHAGKLPKYRGGSPLNWQIINNEKKIGISIIKLDSKIDQGPIICEKKFNNNKNDYIDDVHKKVNNFFIKMIDRSIKILEMKKKLKNQKFSKSYFHQRSDKDGLINFNTNALNVYNFIRALSHPYKGAFFFHKGKKIRIYKSKINTIKSTNKIGKPFKLKRKKNLIIKCKKNNIEVLRTNIGKI